MSCGSGGVIDEASRSSEELLQDQRTFEGGTRLSGDLASQVLYFLGKFVGQFGVNVADRHGRWGSRAVRGRHREGVGGPGVLEYRREPASRRGQDRQIDQ